MVLSVKELAFVEAWSAITSTLLAVNLFGAPARLPRREAHL